MGTNGTNGKAAVDPIARATAVLRKEHSRYFRTGDKCSRTGEGVNYSNPLEELEAEEERAEREAMIDSLEEVARSMAISPDDLPESFCERIKAEALKSFQQWQSQFISWVFAAGPHPIDVEKRLYIFAKHARADLIWNMGFRALGGLFGEKGATVHARSKAALGNVPAGWKKRASACAKMAEAAKGNMNRLGGKKVQRSFLKKLKVQKTTPEK